MTEVRRADFHVHLGERTLKEASENNVSVLGLVERGMVRTKLLRSKIEEGKRFGITVLPGMEVVTSEIIGRERLNFELVALDFDLEHPIIFHHFDPRGPIYQARHKEKLDHQLSVLNKEGLRLNQTPENTVEWNLVMNGEVVDTAGRLCRIAANNPENEDFFKENKLRIEAHLVKRPEDKERSFSQFLYWTLFAVGAPGYRSWGTNAQQVIDIVHEANGVAVVAHPKLKDYKHGPIPAHYLRFLFNIGADGLEGWDAGPLDQELERIAMQANKLVLGGSGKDEMYKNRVIGKGSIDTQNMFIPETKLDEIRCYKTQKLLRTSTSYIN